MAKAPAQVQPLAGFPELQFFCDLLRDATSLKALADGIEEKRKTANDLIELIGPAQEIEAMNARARVNEQASETALAQARAKAEEIVAAAQARAEEIVAAAQELEAGVKQLQAEAAEAKRQAEQATAAAAAEVAGVTQREREVVKSLERAEAMVAAAAAAKTDFEGRSAKLTETLKQLGGG